MFECNEHRTIVVTPGDINHTISAIQYLNFVKKKCVSFQKQRKSISFTKPLHIGIKIRKCNRSKKVSAYLV